MFGNGRQQCVWLIHKITHLSRWMIHDIHRDFYSNSNHNSMILKTDTFVWRQQLSKLKIFWKLGTQSHHYYPDRWEVWGDLWLVFCLIQVSVRASSSRDS